MTEVATPRQPGAPLQALVALCAATNCAWEAPLAPDAALAAAVLRGSVVLQGVDAPDDTFLLLFDAADPPPPEGIGEPANLVALPADRFAEAGEGSYAASYQFTEVQEGLWLLSVLVDVDGDFNPLLTSNAGATCGDLAGGHTGDLDSLELAAIDVAAGSVTDDVIVLAQTELTVERPAISLLTDAIDVAGTELLPFELESVGIASSLLELEGPYDGGDPCGTAFLVHAVDDDGDGQADPHPDAQLAELEALDIWTRTYLEYLGDGSRELQAGERYLAEAIVDTALVDEGLALPGQPEQLTELPLLFVPAALHVSEEGEEQVSGNALPRGSWSVTVVQQTGQTWTVPNELVEHPSRSEEFDPDSQALGLLLE